MKIHLIIIACLCMSFINHSSNKISTWSKAYEHKSTTIYTRTTETGIKEFKAITTLNVKMQTVLGVMADYAKHPDWMRAIKKCEKVEQTTSRTRYLYYTIDMPWPLWDRDLVSKSTFYPKSNGTVLMKMEAAPKKKAKTSDHVRMKSANGYWLLTPINSTKTKVIYQYKADPNGIPAGIVNMFLLEAPKATFSGLEEQVKLAKYKNPDLDWLYGE